MHTCVHIPCSASWVHSRPLLALPYPDVAVPRPATLPYPAVPCLALPYPTLAWPLLASTELVHAQANTTTKEERPERNKKEREEETREEARQVDGEEALQGGHGGPPGGAWRPARRAGMHGGGMYMEAR